MFSNLPRAKTDSIVTQELSGELLIYNLQTNKVVCLNFSAAFVWKYCDGETTFQQLIQAFERETETTINEEFIALSLDMLNKADLIERYSAGKTKRISRRSALLKLSLPVVMLPIVTSLAAPTAAQAQSVVCTNPGATGTCTVASDCPPLSTTCPDGCICGISCTANCCFEQQLCG